MKKIIFLFILGFSSLTFAKEIESNDKTVVRDACDIIHDDVYRYVINHEGTVAEATAIAGAAKQACKDLAKPKPVVK